MAAKDEQRRDPTISQIINIMGSSRTARSLWAELERLELQDDILHRQWETEDGKASKLQLVIARLFVPTVLEQLNNSRSGGHLGITRTVARARDRFYWHGLYSNVESW